MDSATVMFLFVRIFYTLNSLQSPSLPILTSTKVLINLNIVCVAGRSRFVLRVSVFFTHLYREYIDALSMGL